MEEKGSYTNIDEYIAGFRPEIQAKLQEIRKVISETAPEAFEKISYQMPTFDLHGNLVHFASFKNHIGFYPAPSGIEAYENQLAKYKKSKGAVQFPLDEPIPFDLIVKIVEFRVRENLRKEEERLVKKKKSTKKD